MSNEGRGASARLADEMLRQRNIFLVGGILLCLAAGQVRAEEPRRGDASWIGDLQAAVIDVTQLQRLRDEGLLKDPDDAITNLLKVSHGRLNGMVLYVWPGHLFPHERWDIAESKPDDPFSVPRLVALCHARGLKVVGMFNGRHYGVEEDGTEIFEVFRDASGKTRNPQGQDYRGRLDKPMASFYCPKFQRSFAEFCAHAAQAGFDALYLVEYDIPEADLSPAALSHFKDLTGIDANPAEVGDVNGDGQTDTRDSWAYIRRQCYDSWRQMRKERLLEFLKSAQDAANQVRPVPFGVLSAFGAIGKDVRLWQDEELMREALRQADFAGAYCRWFHWRLPPETTEKTIDLIRRLSPDIPILGELYVGSRENGLVPLPPFRDQAELLRSKGIGFYLWLVYLAPAPFSYESIPPEHWLAIPEARLWR